VGANEERQRNPRYRTRREWTGGGGNEGPTEGSQAAGPKGGKSMRVSRHEDGVDLGLVRKANGFLLAPQVILGPVGSRRRGKG